LDDVRGEESRHSTLKRLLKKAPSRSRFCKEEVAEKKAEMTLGSAGLADRATIARNTD
jgi:hypothetical protein